jgi:hypothetical protein
MSITSTLSTTVLPDGARDISVFQNRRVSVWMCLEYALALALDARRRR